MGKTSNKHLRLGRFLCLLALSSALFACGLDPQAGASQAGSSQSGDISGDLQLTGSSTLAPLASEIGKRFEAKHPTVRINIQTGGSSRGIADTKTGLADIGMSSRPLKDSEQAGQTAWTLAMDGVGFIVHADNPVQELSRQQLVDIYTGKVADWSEVGGEAGAITVINRADGRSELELVTQFFAFEAADIRPDLIAGENQQGLKMVANDVRAITYLSIGASEYEITQGAPIKLLPLDGIAASVENVAANRFPLSRPLILVTGSGYSDLAKAFIEFARSTEVHDLVRQLSYVPIAS